MAQRMNTLPSQVARLLFGPWPIVLGPMFGITALVFVVSNSDAIGGTESNGSRFILAALIAIYNAAMMILGVRIAMRIFSIKDRETMTRTQYLVIAAVGGFFLAVSRVSVLYTELIPYPTDAAAYIFVIRGFVYSLLSLSFIGYLYESISRAVVRADALAEQLQKQNSLMVSEDEKLRSSVAQFLHDRVQAQIMAVSLQLQQLFAKSDVKPDLASGGASLVAELERIRSEDLRSAIRSLSPNIPTIGLLAALRELAQTYEPNLVVTLQVEVDQLNPASREIVEMGCYRIVEQALVNCVVHGAATSADVHVKYNGSMVMVQVSDNGTGMAEDVTEGRGFSLVESWTRSLGGLWQLRAAPDGGAVLTCRLLPPVNEQLS